MDFLRNLGARRRTRSRGARFLVVLVAAPLASAHPVQVLASTQSQRTAFDSDRFRPDLDKMAGKRPAPIGVIETSGPLSRPVRPHGDENLNPNKRALPLGGILIVLVGPGFACCGIEPRLDRRDRPTHRTAAAINADRSAVLFAPNAGRISPTGLGGD